MEKTHNHLGSGRSAEVGSDLGWCALAGLVQALKSEHSHGFSASPSLPRKPCTSLTPGSKESAWSRGSLQYPVPPPQPGPSWLFLPMAYLPRSCLALGYQNRVALSVLYSSWAAVTHASQLKLLPPWLHTQKWDTQGAPFSHMKCYQKASSPSSCIWPLSQDTFWSQHFL